MADNPEAAHSHDVPVVATMVDGLRSQVVDGDGTPILATDMPTAVGGEATAPTPGRMMRAALAACDATMITLRAAQLGIKLTILEV